MNEQILWFMFFITFLHISCFLIFRVVAGMFRGKNSQEVYSGKSGVFLQVTLL